MKEEECQILEDLYMDKWEGSAKRSNPRMRKCDALYELAKVAIGEAIVELGTYHGCGAIALSFGARAGTNLPVYTVDDHIGRRGWAGEMYFPQDKARFLDCVKVARADVTLVSRSADDAFPWAVREGLKIGLLFWDLGEEKRLQRDFETWGSLVIPGGVFVIREGGQGGKPHFRSDIFIPRAAESDEWELGEEFHDARIHTLVRC